jgi:drug/metabolite transporter (DMT)-like permease
MFLGEFLCLFAYAFIYWREKKKHGTVAQSPAMIEAKKKGLKTDINVALLAIPACFDVCASSLMFLALVLIPASIYQMMRGMIVFVAAIFSIIFLGRRYFRHHWTALVFVVSGVVIVGASPLLFPEDKKSSLEGDSSSYFEYLTDGLGEEDDSSSGTILLGIGLVVIAQLFAGGLFISEEKLLGDYYLHPLKVVGWEGFWGSFIFMFLLMIFQFIPCHIDSICPHGTLEDTPQALYEMGRNPVILVYGLGVVFSIAFFNGLGVAVTKYASAAQRSTIDTSRTLLIWIIFLLKPGEGNERFIWLELIGFVLLVIGTLVFNEIVVVPIMGFDQYTKTAIESRKLHEEDDDVDPNGLINTGNDKDQQYLASSPASYNYQRNYKNVKKHMENAGHAEDEDLHISGTDV